MRCLITKRIHFLHLLCQWSSLVCMQHINPIPSEQVKAFTSIGTFRTQTDVVSYSARKNLYTCCSTRSCMHGTTFFMHAWCICYRMSAWHLARRKPAQLHLCAAFARICSHLDDLHLHICFPCWLHNGVIFCYILVQ